MDIHIEGTMYGDSYRGYNVWSFIYNVQRKESHMEIRMYGVTYIGYKVWRII